jgi:tetratricopeptide (TPR) repeat protein
MEKNGILDAFCKTLWIIAALFFISSCSLPRIIILEDPLTPEEHINLGVTYERQGELTAALREYEAGAKKLPVAYLYMGNVYFQKEEFEKAESSYKRAIRKSADPRAYNNLAWLYCTKGKNLEEAEKLARKAIELDPESKEFQDTLNKIVEKRKGAKTSLYRPKGLKEPYTARYLC